MDESMVTGESRPIAKSAGQPVIGGTVNNSNVLIIRVGAAPTCDAAESSGAMCQPFAVSLFSNAFCWQCKSFKQCPVPGILGFELEVQA